ncbi:MAG: type II secretion system protein [Verrucomicrobiota bacterium]|nr:type II secretion system protein [Verrucomicrobiota bacterium]
MSPRRANPARAAVSAFTLIELMVVMGLVMVIIGIGVPRMVQQNRTPLGESLNAVMEACAAARRQAILSGGTAKVTIRGADGGTGFIINAGAGGGRPKPASTDDVYTGMEGPLEDAPKPASKPGGGIGFNGRIHDEVSIHGVFVNFEDLMDAELVEVKFYSNGTSDEFTIGMRHEFGDQVLRFGQLDSVTGLAYIKTENEILQN